MLDIKFIRENPEIVKENIKKKYQDAKLPLVDEVIDLDAKRRAAVAEADQLRSARNALSKKIGMLMGQAKKDPSKLEEAEAVKKKSPRMPSAFPSWKSWRRSWRVSFTSGCFKSPKSSTPLCLWGRMTPAMWRCSGLERPWFPISPSPIMWS